jgi:hypothetical protein
VASAIALLSKTTVREGVSSDRGVASNEGILTGIQPGSMSFDSKL